MGIQCLILEIHCCGKSHKSNLLKLKRGFIGRISGVHHILKTLEEQLEAGRSKGSVEEAQQLSHSWHSLTKIWLQKDITATVALN